MILDRIENAAAYSGLGERLAAGLKFLAEFDAASAAEGRVDIQGDEVFALIQRYQTKPIDEGRYEAHRRYIDIQFVAAGAEQIGLGDPSEMEVIEPYDSDKDLVFLAGQGQLVTVSSGMFCVLYPHEAHMPMISIGEGGEVTKVVVKILI